MRKALVSVAATAALLVSGGGAALATAGAAGAATTQVSGAAKSAHEESFLAHVNRNTVNVSGQICLSSSGHPVTGGDCWWESAIQLWYNMKNGTNESGEMATVYDEYNGDFQDGWTDDNAWWGIAFQEAYSKYGVANYDTKANNLWTWDTTPGEGWDSACGGSTIQHSGGSENDISRAALGVLASVIGNSGSASRAASWIYANLQGSDENSAASEGLNTNSSSPCTASTQIAQLGGQVESWKVENLTGGSGQTGTRASAVSQFPDSDYSGQFNLLYDQYIG